jgi:hypothetical protein
MKEAPFTNALAIAIGQRSDLKIWRQNVGDIKVRDNRGRVNRIFHAGPPPGVADLTGYVIPEGWRLEIETKGQATVHSKVQISFARSVIRSGVVYVRTRYDERVSMDHNVQRAISMIETAISYRRRSGRSRFVMWPLLRSKRALSH